jgi:hypothetical protein
MPARIPSRSADLRHHFVQGATWLQESDHGTNTAALSYAAFEFRLTIERLALHYWRQLLERRPEREDFRDIRSFKRIEQRIYALGGHQREINGHFEFMRIVTNMLEIKGDLTTPDLGQLANHWHSCSELCHISWTLSCGVPQMQVAALESLKSVEKFITEQIGGLASWPIIHDPAFADLRDRYVAGKITPGDIEAYLKTVGLWTRIEYKDGRPSEFVGKAIAPNEKPNSER